MKIVNKYHDVLEQQGYTKLISSFQWIRLPARGGCYNGWLAISALPGGPELLAEKWAILHLNGLQSYSDFLHKTDMGCE